MMKEKPEEALLYADTQIIEVVENDNQIIILDIIGFDEEPFKLQFLNCSLKKNDILNSSRIEVGKILNRNNKIKTLKLYDDDNELILEIDYEECNFL